MSLSVANAKRETNPASKFYQSLNALNYGPILLNKKCYTT